jgi:putative membrane protein
MFGLVAVEVKTAGSSTKEAKISALRREKAEQLKSKLRRTVNGQEEVAEAEESEISEQKVYLLTTRDLLVTASTSGRMGVALSIVGAAFSQIDQFISDKEIYQFIEANLPQSTSTSLVVISILSIIVVSWLFSFITTLITYYDFSVEVRKNELLISRGLFERIQLTIPFNRIQAVQVKEGLLRQPFGFVTLVIESAGYGEKEGNSTVLFPLISKHLMHDFLEEVIPEYNYEMEQAETVPPKRALRRYLIRTLWWSLPVILVVWTAIPYGVYSWFLLPMGLLLGYQQYRDAGICTEDDTLIISARQLSKKTAIVKRYRMQATQLKQNPFQKRMTLRDFIVHVASGNQGRSFSVRDIAVQDANRYWQWLAIERQPQPGMQNAPFDHPDAEISSED